eukprot:jgi/Bigna1/91752/estExt_fgenesh1_pg.C_1170007
MQGNISKEISVRQSLMEIAAAEPGCQQDHTKPYKTIQTAKQEGGYVPGAVRAASIALLRGGEVDKAIMYNIEALQDLKHVYLCRSNAACSNNEELQVAHCVGEMVRVRYYHHHSRDIDDHGTNNQGVSSSTVTAAAAAGPALAEAYSLLEGSKDINGGVPATTTLFGGGFSLEELAEEGSIELEEDCLNKAITEQAKPTAVIVILVADLRVAALRDYAVLLEKMEWNGRSRKPEADKLSLEANMIEKEIFKEGEETNMEQVGLLRNIISFGSITDQWLLNVFGRMPF